MSGNFIDGVRRTAERCGMALPRPLAMVSGGPDSVALLRAILELGGEPVVLHVNYGLRGDESGKDADFVRQLCKELLVDCEVRRVSLGGGNLQEAARKERYRIAGEVANARGISNIVTGHTADDVAETVLLNIARGAGLRGLSGIPPVSGRVSRPLIQHRRTDVLRYLKLLGQPYRTDATNLQLKYARNRVRLEVLPIFEDLYPGAGGNIARGAALLREDLEVLESLAAGVVRRRGEEVVVAVADLEKTPLTLQRYAVRRAYAILAPDEPPLGSVAVEDVLRLAERREGTTAIDLPDGVIAVVRLGEELAFYRGAEPFSGERDLLPGQQRFERWTIDVREIRGFDPEDATRPEVAYLDAARGPYRVRLAREGDRMRPLGLGGTKKVYKAMKDRKVPADLRSRTPVVVDGRGRVAWVFLGEMDEAFVVGPKTEDAMRLELRRLP